MVIAELAKLTLIFALPLALLIIIYRFGAEAELYRKFPVQIHLAPKISQIGLRIKSEIMRRSSLCLFLKITLLVVVTRIALFLIGYMAIVMFREESRSFLGTMEWIWNKWDAAHLLNIAEHGYTAEGEMKFFIVFFPFYPLMVRLFSLFTRNYVWAGFLVSHLSLIISCYYLFKLVKMDQDEKAAWRGVKFLLVFPQSFFLNIVYTDSLFLATSILCFYYLRKQKWLWAGFYGCLASLTRNFGILLLLPALMEYVKERRVIQKLRTKEFKVLIREFFSEKGYGILLIAIGLSIYLVINKVVAGDWFAFLKYQSEHWHNNFGFFGENIKNYVQNSFSWKPSQRLTLWIPEVLGIFLVTGLIFYSFGKLRLSYIAYMLVYIFVCVSSTWLISGFRYIVSLFPMYLLLASALRNKITDALFTYTSILMLGFYTVAFVLDFYVM
ncbi:MAG: glycosyltransferase family 39 protein [Bacteroidota bacterium]